MRRAALVLLLLAAGCIPSQGPVMSPGENCLGCHGGVPSATGRGGGARAWSFAGTVYLAPDAPTTAGVEGAVVSVTDASGRTISVRSNLAGNLYSAESLAAPLQACVEYAGVLRCMAGAAPHGACNHCHAVPPLSGAPGRIVAGGTPSPPGGACTSCHGDPSRVATMAGVDALVSSAPPLPPFGAPASVTGAHLLHVNPDPASVVPLPLACAECHVVPSDSGHATNPPAQKVVFGRLATARGASPTFAAAPFNCTATYCHGTFSFGNVTGASAAPTWTDTTPLRCTSCHGLPPTGHPAIAAPATAASCSACHPRSVDPAGAIVQGAAHLDGEASIAALGCTGCHGDASRTGILADTDIDLVSSPPAVPAGAPDHATGAHLGHVNPAAASALRGPLGCVECHVVPTDMSHATVPPARKVVFGPIATASGAVPTWTAASASCAATYCHGNFSFGGIRGNAATVTWTDATPLECTSCHGMPPVGHIGLAPPVTPSRCSACHPLTVKPDGTVNLVGKGHINGKPDGG